MNRSYNFKYIDLLKEIMIDATSVISNECSNNSNKNPSIELAKVLKFEKVEHWMAFGSCLNTYEDSSMAIRGYFKLSKDNSDVDIDYLKLFGFLNAAYLQLGSLRKLVEIVKLPNKKKIEKSLKGHDLICARNMLASHTLDYLDNDGTLNSFTIHQCSIEGSSVRFMNNTTSSLVSYDFDKLFVSWTNETRKILRLIIGKFIKTIYKQNQGKIQFYEKLLVEIN